MFSGGISPEELDGLVKHVVLVLDGARDPVVDRLGEHHTLRLVGELQEVRRKDGHDVAGDHLVDGGVLDDVRQEPEEVANDETVRQRDGAEELLHLGQRVGGVLLDDGEERVAHGSLDQQDRKLPEVEFDCVRGEFGSVSVLCSQSKSL